MATEVLAPGTTAESSADIVVATPTLICLKGSGSGVQPGPTSQVIVEAKDEDGLYWPIGDLCGTGKLSMLLEAAATYRVTRVAANAGYGGKASDYNCGVFTA